MAELFAPVFHWLAARDPVLVYGFLLFNACCESLFPPYPSDAFVLVFAFLAGQGNFNPYGVFVCTVIGSIGGMMILYSIGSSHGNRVIDYLSSTFLGRIFPVKMIERAKVKLFERGDMVSILNRFLPGMRAPLCFASGIVGLPCTKFFLLSLVSVILWNVFLVAAGFYVGSTWDEASAFLKNYSAMAYFVLVLIFAGLTVLYFWKRRNTQ
ncbi:DedA family protein [candidate division WOR-3 bacterium]|nr:DedA family protein [candidate division WOR-3 bacterium]